MWQTKIFKTREEMKTWIIKNKHKYFIAEIYVNNAFAVEYKQLRVIDIK